MNILSEASMWGSYTPTFDPIYNPLSQEVLDNSVVIVYPFGFQLNEEGNKIPGLVNDKLAEYTEENFSDLPILAGEDVAPAFSFKPAEVLRVPSTSNPIATIFNIRNGGTVGELKHAQNYMAYNGRTNAIIVAQDHHVFRVGSIATKLHIQHDIPSGLPSEFDLFSEQPWTRSEEEWQKREKLTILSLKAAGLMPFRD